MTPSKIEKLLLQLTIFLIPTNFFLKFVYDDAFVRGILIDYLLPKLYLSDLLILALLTIWLLKIIKNYWYKDKSKKKKSTINSLLGDSKIRNAIKYFYPLPSPLTPSLTSLPRYLVTLLLLTIIILNLSHLASAWYLAKVAQFILFTVYLTHHYTYQELLSAIKAPLIFALLFQSSIAIYQYIHQSSVIGYYLFGEIDLKTTANVAKSQFSSQVWLLPYGTTPHPNILAGFLATGIVIFYQCVQKNPKHLHRNITLCLVIGLSVLTIILTQSLTAITALSLVFGLSFLSSTKSDRLLFYLIPIISLALYMIFTILNYQLTSLIDNESILRRYKLIQASYSLMQQSPLTGTGLNQFTVKLATDTPLVMPPGFFQPVHNIYLLYIAETGLIGILLLLALAWNFLISKYPNIQSLFSNLKSQISNLTTHHSPLTPLILLLIIGLLDHYLLTLQTGQLLFSLAIALAIAKNT